MMLLPPEACRAARALLGWNQQELAIHSGVSTSTIASLEAGNPVRAELSTKLLDAFASRGVRVVRDSSVGAVLRLDTRGSSLGGS